MVWIPTLSISHEVRPFGRGLTTRSWDFLSIVMNHLLTGMILQAGSTQGVALWVHPSWWLGQVKICI